MSGKSIISKPSSHWHSKHAELSGQAALSVALSHVPKASTETEQRQEQNKKHRNACISSDLLKI